MLKTPESPQFNGIENPEYLTQEGLEHLEKELEELKNKRQEIASRIAEARSLGDITENAEYQSAKDDQLMNEEEIAEKEKIWSCAVIITKEHTADIRLGSSFSLKKEGGDEEEKYSLVGSEEADPLDGKISHESPLGSALIGKKKGEVVEVFTPGGKVIYTISDVG